MAVRLRLPRTVSWTPADGGTRRCAYCGDEIDPVDWCQACKAADAPCGRPHKRLRLRADAAFCNKACRTAHRATFIRDCLPRGASRA